MGVISCRSREASLIPDYVRVKMTKRYCSHLETDTGDVRNASPGWEKGSWLYRESKLMSIASLTTYSSTAK